MNSVLASYARDFKNRELAALGQDKKKNRPIPEVEGTVFRSLPKSGEWSQEQKSEVVNFLKARYPQIQIDAIKNQIISLRKVLRQQLSYMLRMRLGICLT